MTPSSVGAFLTLTLTNDMAASWDNIFIKDYKPPPQTMRFNYNNLTFTFVILGLTNLAHANPDSGWWIPSVNFCFIDWKRRSKEVVPTLIIKL